MHVARWITEVCMIIIHPLHKLNLLLVDAVPSAASASANASASNPYHTARRLRLVNVVQISYKSVCGKASRSVAS